MAEKLGKGDLVKHYQQEVFMLMLDAILESKLEVAKMTPVDTGLMASSWDVKTDKFKAIYFGNDAPHSQFVEWGAKPFSPPIAPLLEWAARKLKKDKTSSEVKSFAWAVKRKIEKHGLEPTHVLKRAIEEVIEPLIEERLASFDPTAKEVK